MLGDSTTTSGREMVSCFPPAALSLCARAAFPAPRQPKHNDRQAEEKPAPHITRRESHHLSLTEASAFDFSFSIHAL